MAPNDDGTVEQGRKEGEVDSIGASRATDNDMLVGLGVAVVVVVVAVSGERAWDAGDKGPKSRHRVGQVLI